MICILRLRDGDIACWIIATDIHDARQQAQIAGEDALADELYRMEFAPRLGKHKLQSGHWMLVS